MQTLTPTRARGVNRVIWNLQHAGNGPVVHTGTYEVRAVSGGDCLRLLRGNPRARASMVLLDLNTHGDDGRDALREIRSDDSLKAVPVVKRSAEGED